MRPWLSGIMSPCQGLVGVSITPGRTYEKDPPKGSFSYVRPGERCLRTFRGNRNRRNDVALLRMRRDPRHLLDLEP